MKKQYREITIMNAFLCLAVVMIHLTSAPLGQLIPKSVPHIIIFIINKVLCFCVPAFLFLSGFKLYNKHKNEKIKLKKFYGERLKKIVVPYVVAVIIYFVYFYIKGWVDFKALPEYLLLGTLSAHFYYIVIAVQCYLLFPLLKLVFKKFPKITLLLAFASTIIFNHYIIIPYGDRFIGTYLFYFILGFALTKFNIKKYYGSATLGMIFISAVHLYFSYLQMVDGAYYPYANLVNVAYVTTAIIAIYYTCMGIKKNFVYSFSKAISGVSYNVYLYHILVLSVLWYDFFPNFNLSVRDEFLVSTAIVNVLIILYGYIAER